MEKNYLLYDETYLGPGYFVVHKEGEQITSFFKFYKIDGCGFPVFNFRAFSIDGIDDPDEDFTDVAFTFNKENDGENGLYNAFYYASSIIYRELTTIDRFHQGNNKLTFDQAEDCVKITASKDIWNADHYTDFIDIVLGDDMTCPCYYELSLAYRKLGELDAPTMSEEQRNKILSLKINKRS